MRRTVCVFGFLLCVGLIPILGCSSGDSADSDATQNIEDGFVSAEDTAGATDAAVGPEKGEDSGESNLEGNDTSASTESDSSESREEPPPWSDGEDKDGDGVSNEMEAIAGTDPTNPDTDGDGVQDGAEFELGTKPLEMDSDLDGIIDGVEVEQGTDPAKSDTDGDGFGDDEEDFLKTDPKDRFSWAFGGTRWPDMRPYADGVYGTGWNQGDVMPDAELIDQWGQVLELSQFYGYVILLDFSAGWCVPCREAAKTAESLWVSYRDQGFMVVHILNEGAQQGTPATLALQEQWADSYGITFPVVREKTKEAYPNLSFADLYPGSIPFLLLLDRSMKIDSGYGANQETAIATRVQELLSQDLPQKALPVPGESGEGESNICDQDGDGSKNVSCGGDDCYDRDVAFGPGVPELCDEFDRNCDGRVHQYAEDTALIYADLDQDGYGNPDSSLASCSLMWPYSENADDCDDGNPKLSPETLWYLDEDGDGLGQCEATKASCLQPEGYANNGQDSDDDDPLVLGFWEKVTVGRDHSCGLRQDGRVVCWGGNSAGQCDVPEGLVFTEVSAGYKHTCGLLEDGTPRCWGMNMYNATVAPTTTSFDSLACGLNFCCGLTGTTGNNVQCWGANAEGQSTPPEGTFLQVSARGGRHACGIKEDGKLLCWGSSDGFQGGPDPTAAPNDESHTFKELSAGHFYSCAVRDDDEVVCWGTNKHGQGTAPAGEVFEKLRAGTVHSCGLTSAGEIRCWGSGSFGRTNSPDGLYTDIDVDQLHSCAVGVDGLIRCWGYSDKGQTKPICAE